MAPRDDDSVVSALSWELVNDGANFTAAMDNRVQECKYGQTIWDDSMVDACSFAFSRDKQKHLCKKHKFLLESAIAGPHAIAQAYRPEKLVRECSKARRKQSRARF
jgi:hypothetical protein